MKKLIWVLNLIIIISIAATSAFAAAKDVVSVQFYDVDNQVYRDQTVTTVDLVYDGEVLNTDVPAFIDRGRTLVPIYIIGNLLDADVMWNQEFRRATIQTADTMVILTIGSNTAHVNGKKVELPDGVPAALVKYDGSDRTMVPWRFVAEQLGAQVEWDPETYSVTLFFNTSDPPPTQEPTPEPPKDDEGGSEETGSDETTEAIPEEPAFEHTFTTIEEAVVVLDAGHGGDDPGAVYFDVLEKDVNFSVMQKVNDLLLDYGVTVYLTREDNTRVSLSERTDFANELGADIFVSMHSNAADKAPTASGIETYYYSEDRFGETLAEFVQSAVIESTEAKNRKTKTANFYVCKNTDMPAVLVEMGFLTNETECHKLIDEEYQTKLAEGIVQGIIDYINSVLDEKSERSNETTLRFFYDLVVTASSLNRRVMHQIPARPTSAYTIRLISAP